MSIFLSYTEENYLKAIYHLSNAGSESVSTNALAESINTKPATVSDMIRKLSDKKVISYEKYRGVNISESGIELALKVIRKHRLWEVFLVEKLHFRWDEVHEIAEQLEHIQSPELVEKLDEFLGHPKVDPHGDPIPDNQGKFHVGPTVTLLETQIGDRVVLSTVGSSDPLLLQYLDSQKIHLGLKFLVQDKVAFDGSMKLKKDDQKELFISAIIAAQLMVKKIV